MTQYRTVAQVVGTYRDQLTNFVYETLNGSMDAIDLRRAHREMIRRLGTSAYTEGLREGGVPAEELDATDRKAIQEWLTGQLAHINKFASDTVAARGDDGKRSQILSRLDMWVNAMQTIGGMGLMSAQKNRMGTWRLGKTELHCRTCNGLHGKRHRLSWYTSRGLIPREPGSAALECKGYKCLCGIYDGDGKILVPSMRAVRFDPNQPRDEQGQWTDTGIEGGARIPESEIKVSAREKAHIDKFYSERIWDILNTKWTSQETKDMAIQLAQLEWQLSLRNEPRNKEASQLADEVDERMEKELREAAQKATTIKKIMSKKLKK